MQCLIELIYKEEKKMAKVKGAKTAQELEDLANEKLVQAKKEGVRLRQQAKKIRDKELLSFSKHAVDFINNKITKEELEEIAISMNLVLKEKEEVE